MRLPGFAPPIVALVLVSTMGCGSTSDGGSAPASTSEPPPPIPSCAGEHAGEARCNEPWMTPLFDRDGGWPHGGTVDGRGDVIVVGDWMHLLTPDGSEIDDQAFVTKLSGATGEMLWMTEVGGAGFDEASTVVLDADGNVFISGRTSGETPLTAPDLTFHGFVAKVRGTDGALLFRRELSDSVNLVGLDPRGNLVMLGNGQLVRLSPEDGAEQLRRQLPPDSLSWGKSVQVSADGNLLLVGARQVDPERGIYTTAVMKISSQDGTAEWTWAFEGDPPLELAVAGRHADGRLSGLVMSDVNDEKTWLTATLTPEPPALTVGPVAAVPRPHGDGPECALAPSGHLLVASSRLAETGPEDAYVARVSLETGAVGPMTVISTSARDRAFGVLSDGAGNPILLGSFEGGDDSVTEGSFVRKIILESSGGGLKG